MTKKPIILTFIAMTILSFAIPALDFKNEGPESQSVQYRVNIYKQENGSFNGIATFKITEDSTFLNEGLNVDLNDHGGSYGNIKTIVVPHCDRITNYLKRDSLYPIKDGKWVYFKQNGEVDSIIDYESYKDLVVLVDTTPFDQGYYIDSIYKVLYDKKVIYKKE